MATSERWRLVLSTGEVREIGTEKHPNAAAHDAWIIGERVLRPQAIGRTIEHAAWDLARQLRAVEIIAPGQTTRAEALAEARGVVNKTLLAFDEAYRVNLALPSTCKTACEGQRRAVAEALESLAKQFDDIAESERVAARVEERASGKAHATVLRQNVWAFVKAAGIVRARMNGAEEPK